MSETKNPWDYMGPAETAILGDVVLNPEEQSRWARAILFGTLPYMWRDKAASVREDIYNRLALKPGDKVLIIGECVKVCGFDADMQARMDGKGQVDIVDITDFARRAYIDGVVGPPAASWPPGSGRTRSRRPTQHYDAVAILQSIQHTDDWHESRPASSRASSSRAAAILLAEIMLGPNIMEAAQRRRAHRGVGRQDLLAHGLEDRPDFPTTASNSWACGLRRRGRRTRSLIYWKGIEVFCRDKKPVS